MAVKKEVLEEILNEEPVTEPEEEKVTIRLPLTKEDQRDVFVRVNQRTWQIQRGVTVQVPKCVQEVLEHSEEAMLEAMEYQSKVQKD